MITDIYDFPYKLPDIAQRPPVGNRLSDSGDNTDDDSVSDGSTRIMPENATDSQPNEVTELILSVLSLIIKLETDPIVIQDLSNIFTLLREKYILETNTVTKLEKPFRKIGGKGMIQPSSTDAEPRFPNVDEKKALNLEIDKDLTGIASSSKDSEIFTLAIDKEANGIASSGGSFRGNGMASLDMDKKVNGLGYDDISDSISKDEILLTVDRVVNGIASSSNAGESGGKEKEPNQILLELDKIVIAIGSSNF